MEIRIPLEKIEKYCKSFNDKDMQYVYDLAKDKIYVSFATDKRDQK